MLDGDDFFVGDGEVYILKEGTCIAILNSKNEKEKEDVR
jgi:hypothetical protein